MKTFNFVSLLSDPKSRTCLFSLFITASLIGGIYFVGSAFFANDYRVPQGLQTSRQNTQSSKYMMPQRSEMEVNGTEQDTKSENCKKRCRPPGSEAWPEGILATTSDLDMRPMWGALENNNSKHSVSLLAIAAGIKQKDLVNQIVEKFLEHDFVVMLFHYDGVVDQWGDLGWATRVLHVSAVNQTKWWFAKRFLHPDIVAEYDYVFLWDEDLGVENFHPGRYVSIIKEEGLEISQPALDPAKSEIHHQITVRRRKSKVHRRYIKLKGGGRCYDNSTGPPCLGWVEMMAPVFSKAAWRCAWYLIQNDLIHAWGVDFQLGYCAQGDRKKNVGVVDAEYIVHLGVPTLGGGSVVSTSSKDTHGNHSTIKHPDSDDPEVEPPPVNTEFHPGESRSEVRRQSYIEMRIFWSRWWRSVKEDKCWVDPYQSKKKKHKCLVRPCQLDKKVTT